MSSDPEDSIDSIGDELEKTKSSPSTPSSVSSWIDVEEPSSPMSERRLQPTPISSPSPVLEPQAKANVEEEVMKDDESPSPSPRVQDVAEIKVPPSFSKGLQGRDQNSPVKPASFSKTLLTQLSKLLGLKTLGLPPTTAAFAAGVVCGGIFGYLLHFYLSYRNFKPLQEKEAELKRIRRLFEKYLSRPVVVRMRNDANMF